jgi:hypothetical protein
VGWISRSTHRLSQNPCGGGENGAVHLGTHPCSPNVPAVPPAPAPALAAQFATAAKASAYAEAVAVACRRPGGQQQCKASRRRQLIQPAGVHEVHGTASSKAAARQARLRGNGNRFPQSRTTAWEMAELEAEAVPPPLAHASAVAA